jgi:hypothetical protein
MTPEYPVPTLVGNRWARWGKKPYFPLPHHHPIGVGGGVGGILVGQFKVGKR